MYKRLLLMAKPWWKNMIVTVVALNAAAILNMIPSELIRLMTARLTDDNDLTYATVLTFFLFLTVSYLLRAVMRFLSLWQAHVAAWGFVADTTLKVYKKLQDLPMAYFAKNETGEIMSRSVNDTRNLEVLIAHALPDLFSGIIVILFVTVRIFLINPVLAAITLIPVPFAVWISTLFSKKVKPYFRRNQAFLAKLNSRFQEQISGIREVKAFCKEDAEYKTMKEYAKEYAYLNTKANFVNGIYQPSVETVISMGTAIVMGIGGVLILRDKLSTADLVGFFVYLSMFYTPLSTLGRVVEDIQSSFAGGARVLEVLDTEITIQDTENSVCINNVVGNIDFDRVSFSYQSGENVLENMSFRANAGEMVAVVGATGAGKTTVINLLERFYEQTNGVIRLDGRDIREIKLSSLRKNISIVPQDVFLFNGSIYDNIAYGKENATEEEIVNAAKTAYADEFIQAMPNGYKTQIGERGTRLSGGQKQRIAIARAVLRESPILVLDEATSAVDNETEGKIQKAIDSLAGKRTILVIAHRLSTVRKADKILVLKEGKIAESGTHEELLQQNGLYANMYRSASDKEFFAE